MDHTQCALLLWVTFIGGRAASPVEPRHSARRQEPESPRAAAAAAMQRTVTRVLPLPPDAPRWPRLGSVSRSDSEDEALSPGAGSSLPLDDDEEVTASAAARAPVIVDSEEECRSRTPSARLLHDRTPFVDSRQGGRGAPKRDDDFEYEPAFGPDSYEPVLEADGVNHAPPYGAAEISVSSTSNKHGNEEVHASVADGRGPIVVRGPPINSVAIGFLIYLILLTVLQNSIFNITRKGLLGLGPLRDRERRDMEIVLADRRLRLVDDLDAQNLKHEPVLVAAVLDSEPGESGQWTLGGPRRARRSEE